MLWGYWQQEWLLSEKVDFDGVNKLIIVHPEVVALDIRQDLYSAWVRWLPLQNNTCFLPAMRFTGLDAIPGGQTGDSYFLQNSWKLVIDITKVKVSGVLFSDNFETAYYSPELLPIYPASVAAIVNTVTLGGTSAVDIRQEIDNNSIKLQQLDTSIQGIPTQVWAKDITTMSSGIGLWIKTKLLTVAKFIGLK